VQLRSWVVLPISAKNSGVTPKRPEAIERTRLNACLEQQPPDEANRLFAIEQAANPDPSLLRKAEIDEHRVNRGQVHITWSAASSLLRKAEIDEHCFV
jgi:hypothetical protein